MGPRFAVHAGAPRFKVRALSAALAILMVASPVAAKPKGKAAQVEFERGVAAFQKKDFATARDAFTKSLAIEQDVEAKYALMQTERLLGNCDATIRIAKELLEGETKTANKQALNDTIEQCRSSAPPKEPAVTAPAPGGPSSGSPPEATVSTGSGSVPPTEDRPPPMPETQSPWWKDPYGDALVAAGIVGVGVGVGFLWSAHKATDKRDAFNTGKEEDREEFDKYKDRGKVHGTIGLIAGITGVVLVGGGIYRYMTRGGGREEKTAMTGWVTADGGGIAAIGRF